MSTEIAQLFLQLSDDLGVDRDQLIASADIDPIWLEKPDAFMPVDSLYHLTKQVAKLAGSEDIGLWAGRANFLNQASLLKYLSAICSHFRQWLHMIPSAPLTTAGIGETVVVRDGDMLCTEWRPTVSMAVSGRYIADMMLSASQCLLNSVCYRPVPVPTVYFNYPEPEDTTVHRQVFGGQLVFDQPFCGLFYPAEALVWPIIKVWDEKSPVAENNLLSIIEKGSSDGFMRRLRRSIVRALPSGKMTIDTIANELAISRRTLQRRLSERNEVFANVVQELRSAMAVRLLTDKQIPVTEIAFMLGYANISSFSTAFKGWHGCSPRDFVS
ncbi:AraC family transcriptional regulator [Pseudomaricurvus alkylphenolicus]|uniref:AraC family transcriptional regulator ligand-binding domain-containing protein n=1 Tax=Pseudomaricurvus alkylphenolicus TaxID=1306991 RepID=UPI00141F5C4D|nr:AraC family transcriptional regulator [Pseudomaricurvus alkylphenolicus]